MEVSAWFDEEIRWLEKQERETIRVGPPSEPIPRGMGAAPNTIYWIRKAGTWQERERRVYAVLEREGYRMPERARDVDRSQEGQKVEIAGRDMTIRYTFTSKMGQREVMIYHLVEREVNHILLKRLEAYHEPAIQYLGEIPSIVCKGIMTRLAGRIFFTSTIKYDLDDLGNHSLRVVLRKDKSGIWYVDSFFPTVPR